jgi:hypothetical protein
LAPTLYASLNEKEYYGYSLLHYAVAQKQIGCFWLMFNQLNSIEQQQALREPCQTGAHQKQTLWDMAKAHPTLRILLASFININESSAAAEKSNKNNSEDDEVKNKSRIRRKAKC